MIYTTDCSASSAKQLASLDLFSGIGGWSLACERQGIRTAAACELDPWKRSQYGAHFPAVRQYVDIRELTGRRLTDDGISIDVVVVGQSLGRYNGAEQPPPQRTAHGGWRDAAVGLACHLRMDDGLPSGVAADCRSAYGDAIVPQVGSAALAGMLALERFLEAGHAV